MAQMNRALIAKVAYLYIGSPMRTALTGYGGRRGSALGDDNLGCTVRNKDVVNDGREGVFHGCSDDSI
jgi:hypothetical protein